MKTCSAEGCKSMSRVRGLCEKHYSRWRYHQSRDLSNAREPLTLEDRHRDENGRLDVAAYCRALDERANVGAGAPR